MAEGLLAAHAVTTIHYLVRKEMGATKAGRIIVAIHDAVMRVALQLSCPDFEDVVTAAAARLGGCEGCDYIVTRDPMGSADFRSGP